MPRLSQELNVTTTSKVELSTKVQNTLKKVLTEYRELKQKAAATDQELAAHKNELESIFVDADVYEALEEGVRINTPFGEVPLKIIKDSETAADGTKKRGKLNETKLMKKFKLTPKDLDACRDEYKPKASYLGVYLPREGDDE